MNNELLAVFEYMERERKLDRETLIELVESALQVAGRKSIGRVRDLRIAIDRKTLEIKAFASIQVVDFVRNRQEEISLGEAQAKYPGKEWKLGDLIEIEVTPRNFGRIAAQTAKQAIIQKLRMAEKDKVYANYKDHVGEIVTGTVRRFERSDVIVDLGDAEGLMPSRERVPSEEYQPGDRIRFLLLNLDSATAGTQLTLSRASPDFIRKLFELEVSEIADGTVEIKGLAREAGFRTKIAVHSNDEKVDPVGACVGLRGQRVKNIVRELSGEKVDIVKWSTDIKTFVTNSLAPAKLLRLDVDELENAVKVIVEADQLSLAIGKKGQNARLTAKLTGWKIDVQKDEADITFEEKIARATAQLAAIEGIGQENAARLVAAGFLTLEGILAAEIQDLVDVEGFDADTAGQVRAAAEAAFERENGKAGDDA
ncbi:MAG: transcription termination/antitermination protein NusA [Kiritimatiellae bacterium]|jgi:N utilization substance protein A|nr:transcription termination/antitermination protein NusA [Kiritimatiellia bacterium]NLD89411.1 transcription termination/antitermination protein NusA [Lentisphaerota bacterium]HOU21018.1 transcription termination factor NusA [Kiritimatiellia bacterium]HPC19132.1 transcription termination factor NusA [Kiritimatiellia bacterium]HQN80641.1 transcription termination factor NusA [Kiritimatiellia bacterium]